MIGDDETGFRGNGSAPYRLEGWDFILAGGAVYDNLDWSFICGHEDGTANPKAPGGRGPVIRRQLEILKDFINSFDFIRMTPDNSVIKRVTPAAASARALVEPGRAYALYVRGGGAANLVLQLPAGMYRVEWVNTRTGKSDRSETLEHPGGETTLGSPAFDKDIALRIKRAP